VVVELSYCVCFFRGVHTGSMAGMGDIILSQAHRCWSFMDSIVRFGVQLLPLPSAIHCLTATTPTLTVTLSANAEGSALGASGVVGWMFCLGGVGLVIFNQISSFAYTFSPFSNR
jgi:hypothetical protein